jgi:superoxide dismutase, Fe-Mn family
MDYQEKTFTIPELKGISSESVRQHLGLYSGYVKNFNAISKLMPEYAGDESKTLPLAELIRRRSFEFGGMRLHEHYFSQFEAGAKALNPESSLAKALENDYKKAEHVVPYLKAIAGLRGPGWAILYWDAEAKQFLAGFTGEQHMGHFVTLPIILALDVWEHAYVLDYGAAGKGKYVDAFFDNLNWSVVEQRFAKV